MITEFEEEVAALKSAEDFLSFFQIDYDPGLIQTKRIQLLRLFHHVLSTLPQPWQHKEYKKALKVAYKQLENGNELAFSPSACNGCTACDDEE